MLAGFPIPVVALLSWLIEPLALSIPPIEIISVASAAMASGLMVAGGRSSRVTGVVLVTAYVGIAAMLFVTGNR